MIRILNFCLFFFLKILIPSKKNYLVFGHRSGRRFGDNSRYMFIYLNQNYKDKRCIWITKEIKILKLVRSMGYECYLNSSIKGIYFSLISYWHIYDCYEDDINLDITKLSNNINLWHGTLFKKLIKNKNSITKNSIFKLSNLFFKKYIVYPNKIYSKHLLSHYPSKKYKLIISNSPRNILLKKKVLKKDTKYFTKKEKKISDKFSKLNKKIVGYFPTWRFNGMEVFPETLKRDDLKKFNNFLVKNNYLFVIKKHPNSYKEDNHQLYNKDSEKIFKTLEKFRGFYLLDYDIDLNSIIKNCDLLVSDYSGAVFDFLLLERPIIFYVPDIKTYKKNPGLHFDLEKLEIGPLVSNIKGLMNQLSKNNAHVRYKNNIVKFRKKVFKNENCFENIVKIIN
tara:strand:+ start:39 stop:1220 length:1182 start_codon:yes stop_codon:yes gene_type:complete